MSPKNLCALQSIQTFVARSAFPTRVAAGWPGLEAQAEAPVAPRWPAGSPGLPFGPAPAPLPTPPRGGEGAGQGLRRRTPSPTPSREAQLTESLHARGDRARDQPKAQRDPAAPATPTGRAKRAARRASPRRAAIKLPNSN